MATETERVAQESTNLPLLWLVECKVKLLI